MGFRDESQHLPAIGSLVVDACRRVGEIMSSATIMIQLFAAVPSFVAIRPDQGPHHRAAASGLFQTLNQHGAMNPLPTN